MPKLTIAGAPEKTALRIAFAQGPTSPPHENTLNPGAAAILASAFSPVTTINKAPRLVARPHFGSMLYASPRMGPTQAFLQSIGGVEENANRSVTCEHCSELSARLFTCSKYGH